MRYTSKMNFLKKSTSYCIRLWITLVAVFSLLVVNLPVRTAQAASLTSVKDILSTLVDGANANHTISFVAPSAVANNTTIVLTFATGFSLTGVVEDDVDIAGSTEGELTTAADCAATDKASVVISSPTITFNLCTGDGGDFTASETITIEIGNHATSSGTGANQINNQTVAQNTTDPTIDIATALDSGSLAVETIADDSVNVIATVDPSLTFSISDTAIGFGILNSSSACWAIGSPSGACTTADTSAHNMQIATNAVGGWVLTYTNTDQLIDGTKKIPDDPGDTTITNNADGTPGTEEFALGFSTDGNATVAAAYDHNATAGNRDWAYDKAPSSPVTIFSEIVPTATETISAFYLANITGATEAGNYQTDITYIATATF